MSTLLSLLIVVCINILYCSADYECEWITPNATYNLCKMQLSSDSADSKTYYEVFDTRDYVYYNYTYIFNVCNDIESKPPDEVCWNNTLRDGLMPIGYCQQENINQTDGECIEETPITNYTAAYQVHRGMDTDGVIHDCYRMHNGIDKPIFSYIDPSDPSIGVRLTYINGDWCDVANKNREFSLEFYCSEILENIPDKKEEEIEETEICSYVLQIETSYGCPVQCPISETNNRLCDGHGICDFDNTNSKPQCYCYYGYCGDDCSQTGTVCNENNNILYNVTAPNDDESCLFELTDSFGIKAYYNLSYFNLNDENFVVDDMMDREYVYMFNICGDIENFDDETVIPSSCTNYNHGPCTYFTETSWISESNKTESYKSCENEYDTFDSGSVAKAVQIFYPKQNKSEPMCYWLGMDLPDGFNMVSYDISLLDKNDSGRGVEFKILNGQYCMEGARNRELNVKLSCPDTLFFEFDPDDEAKTILNESIYESADEPCVYTIELESPLACPIQCIYKGFDNNIPSNRKKTFSVCANHGICASDPEAKQIRCICDDGWTGIDCSVQISDITTTQSGGDNISTTSNGDNGNGNGDGGNGGSKNGLGIGLGIGIAVLVIIVLAFFFYTQRRKRLLEGQYDKLNEAGLINAAGVEAGQ